MIPQALILILLSLPLPPAVQGTGSVTLLEGSVRVIRGTTVFQGAEGMYVRPGDILESSEQAFVQIEFASGAVVALGPSTRLYIFQHSPAGAGSEHTAAVDLLLLSGWLKGESSAAKGSYRYHSPLLSVSTTGGTVVLHGNETGCDIFLESGSASIEEVSPNGSSQHSTNAKAGQFTSRHKGAGVNSVPRPSPAFLDSMPRPFRDTLPPRLAHFAGRSVEPRAGHPVSYVEIQHWLTMPSTWRRGFAERFAPRLSDPDFRKQIELHVHDFPEWDPFLHPEKNSESPQARN